MATLSAVLEIARSSRNQFNHLMRVANAYRTPFAETSPGVALELNYPNALEVVFVAALMRAGLSTRDAVEEANFWIADHRGADFAPFIAVNRTTGARGTFRAESFAFGQLRQALPDVPRSPGTEIAIIDRAELVGRVRLLFED